MRSRSLQMSQIRIMLSIVWQFWRRVLYRTCDRTWRTISQGLDTWLWLPQHVLDRKFFLTKVPGSDSWDGDVIQCQTSLFSYLTRGNIFTQIHLEMRMFSSIRSMFNVELVYFTGCRPQSRYLAGETCQSHIPVNAALPRPDSELVSPSLNWFLTFVLVEKVRYIVFVLIVWSHSIW